MLMCSLFISKISPVVGGLSTIATSSIKNPWRSYLCRTRKFDTYWYICVNSNVLLSSCACLYVILQGRTCEIWQIDSISSQQFTQIRNWDNQCLSSLNQKEMC